MKKLTLKAIALSIILAFISSSAFAQWQVDYTYGFKINVPTDWTKKSYMDGTDKVYDYYSADENAAIQLRVFKADGRVTTELLAQIYEQSMLPAGTNKQSLNNYTSVNGIPGKQGVYTLNYNGSLVNMAAFYTVQNNIGYVITAMIPANMIAQKGEEVKRITQSFVINGFEQNSNITEQKKPTGGLGSINMETEIQKSSNSRLGVILPEGQYWVKGNYTGGVYLCDQQLGKIIIEQNNITWQGQTSGYYRHIMTGGSGELELRLAPNIYDGSRIYATIRKDGNFISFYYPLPSGRAVMTVQTPNMSLTTVHCKMVKQ